MIQIAPVGHHSKLSRATCPFPSSRVHKARSKTSPARAGGSLMDMPMDYNTGPISRTASSASETNNDFSWINSSTGSSTRSLPSLTSIRREASKAKSAVDKHLRSRARSRKKKSRPRKRRAVKASGVVQRLRASPLGKIQSRTFNPTTNYANNHALGEHNRTTGGHTHTFRSDHDSSGRMCNACWSNPDKVVGLETGMKSINRYMVRITSLGMEDTMV